MKIKILTSIILFFIIGSNVVYAEVTNSEEVDVAQRFESAQAEWDRQQEMVRAQVGALRERQQAADQAFREQEQARLDYLVENEVITREQADTELETVMQNREMANRGIEAERIQEMESSEEYMRAEREFDESLREASEGNEDVKAPVIIKPSTLPGPSMAQQENKEVKKFILTDFIPRFAKGFIGIVGVTSTIFIIVGGLQFALAFGDTEKVGNARKTITYAAIGFVLSLLSYAIVSIITTLL